MNDAIASGAETPVVPDDRGRTHAALIFAGSAALLMGAYMFEIWGGLSPCPLCLLQRYFHFAVVPIGVTAFLVPNRRWRMALLGLGVLVLIGSAGMALFHVGVEWKWWEGLPGCAGGLDGGGFSSDPTKMLKQAEAGPGPRCDEIAWSMFGLSMAGWNVVASLFLAGIAAAGVLRLRRPA